MDPNMKFEIYKSFIFFLNLIPVFTNNVFANENNDIINYKCNISGCTVSCGYKQQDQTIISGIKSITAIIYSNGTTRLELNKGPISGSQTIIIGPKTYICNIYNRK